MIVRQTARAIILSDSDESVLLMNTRTDRGSTLWITPGGTVEDGESLEQALIREVAEVCGFEEEFETQLVWTGEHSFIFAGEEYQDSEAYFLVRVPKFTPDASGNDCEAERESFIEFKWWQQDEILKADDEFHPEKMGTHLSELLQNPLPELPVDISAE